MNASPQPRTSLSPRPSTDSGTFDSQAVALAAVQYNRVSRQQLLALGLTDEAVDHRLDRGRLVAVEPGVFAFPPLLDDDRGLWMGATLTTPDSHLSHFSAAAAYGYWTWPRQFETVTRPGDGGPRRHGGVLVFRSTTLAGDTTMLGPIPITTPERTLLDLAAHVSPKALARALRECLRLKLTTLSRICAVLDRHRRRRGAARLARAVVRYAGLPVERARSGAEVQALLILRDAGRVVPQLNRRIAGEEADLVFPVQRLIIEIDGGPFHLDAGEDARKQALWEGAGWQVRRIPSHAVYDHPARLVLLAPRGERP